MVGANVMVGVKVMVGVNVTTGVNVASGVDVKACVSVSVGGGEVGVIACNDDMLQARADNINTINGKALFFI